MKRHIPLLLSLALLLPLAACGGGGEAEATPGAEPEGLTPVAEAHKLPEGMDSATALCVAGARIWLGGLGADGAVWGWVEPGAGSALVGGIDAAQIYAMCETDGGLALLAGGKTEGDGPELALSLLTLDPEGAVLSVVPLKERYAAAFHSLLPVENGFVACAAETLIGFDAAGEVFGHIDSRETGPLASMCLYEGEILVSRYKPEANGSVICELEPDAFALRERTDAGTLFISALGVSGDGALMASDADIVTGAFGQLALGTGKLSQRFRWADVGVEMQSYRKIEAIPDGYAFFSPPMDEVFTVVWREDDRIELVMALDSTVSDWDGGMAAPHADVYTMVARFNRESKDHKITIKRYLESEMTALKTEIISGGGPDLFAFGFDGTLAGLERSGLYADLFPYLDADGEYSRETIVPSLLSAMQTGDSLYYLPHSFHMVTCWTPEPAFTGSGLTLEELYAMHETSGDPRPLFPEWMTRGMLLSWIELFSLGRFVDRENAVCSFDNAGFAGLLELCIGQPAEDSAGTSGQCLLHPTYIESLPRFAFLSSSLAEGQSSSYVGFPAGDTNGSAFVPRMRFAISSQTEHKDAAWAFLRSTLSEENQTPVIDSMDYCRWIPASAGVLDASLNSLLKYGIDVSGTVYALAEEDAEKAMELIHNTTLITGQDPELGRIMEEEASVFFAGDCTAEQAAASIQRRAALYLSEQYD